MPGTSFIASGVPTPREGPNPLGGLLPQTKSPLGIPGCLPTIRGGSPLKHPSVLLNSTNCAKNVVPGGEVPRLGQVPDEFGETKLRQG